MSILDKKGINVTSGFKLISGQPIDARQVVEDETELQSIIDNGAAYEGLEVWVKSASKKYRYVGSSFVEVAEGSDILSEAIVDVDKLPEVDVNEQVFYRVSSKGAIPETGIIKLSDFKINFNLSIEETVAILKTLEYVDIGDNTYTYYCPLAIDFGGSKEPLLEIKYNAENDIYVIAFLNNKIFANKTNSTLNTNEGWDEYIYNTVLRMAIEEYGLTEVTAVSQTESGMVYQNDKIIDIMYIDGGSYKLYHCKNGVFYEIGGQIAAPTVTEKTITIVKTMEGTDAESTIQFTSEEIKQLTDSEDIIIRVFLGDSTNLPLTNGAYIDYKKIATTVFEGSSIIQLFGMRPEKAAVRLMTIMVIDGNTTVTAKTLDPENLGLITNVSVNYADLLNGPVSIQSSFNNLYDDWRYELSLAVTVNSKTYDVWARKILDDYLTASVKTLQFEAYAEIPNGDGSVTIIDKILTVNSSDYLLTMTDRASSGSSGSGDLTNKLIFNFDSDGNFVPIEGDAELEATILTDTDDSGQFIAISIPYEQFSSLSPGEYYLGKGNNVGFSYNFKICVLNQNGETGLFLSQYAFTSMEGLDIMQVIPLFIEGQINIMLKIKRYSYDTFTNVTAADQNSWLGKCILRKLS